jgi:putative endonuclease
MSFYVYIVASGRNGTIYIGSTDNLSKRIWEHKTKARPGFTKTYGCDRLVWFETFASRGEAAGSCC